VGKRRGKARQRNRGGDRGGGMTGEGEEGREGEGRQEKGGEGERKGNLAPTVISKSWRLWSTQPHDNTEFFTA